MHRFAVGAVAVLLAVPASLPGQVPTLVTPKASQRAKVTQTVGLTEISITYDRPLVGKREVWGKLVPYDSVWRAGANENTVFAVTSPVQVGGQTVPAGRYGLHMIPTAGEWTIILSRQASAWGSFSYDPKEDVLRLKAKPVAAPFQEALAYTFEDPAPGTVRPTLRWEKLAVAFDVGVDAKQVTVDSLRNQLRGLNKFFWQPWSQAAAWCNANEVNLAEAADWTAQSIAINPNFTNLQMRATLLEKTGRTDSLAAIRRQALAVATEVDINAYGYQLIGQGKVDSAIVVFHKNVKDYPKSWNTYDSLGEAYATKGDKRRAIEQYTKAQRMATDPTQRQRIAGILSGLQS